MSSNDKYEELWHEFTQKVTKLEQKRILPSNYSINKISIKPRFLTLPSLPLIKSPVEKINQKYIKKIKNGTIKIDKILDFHGLTSKMAKQFFEKAVKECFFKQQRLILIITGKGTNNQGTLKQQLPLWINEEEIRPFISGFSNSMSYHGGEGAFYLTIKKNKTSNIDSNFLF